MSTDHFDKAILLPLLSFVKNKLRKVPYRSVPAQRSGQGSLQQQGLKDMEAEHTDKDQGKAQGRGMKADKRNKRRVARVRKCKSRFRTLAAGQHMFLNRPRLPAPPGCLQASRYLDHMLLNQIDLSRQRIQWPDAAGARRSRYRVMPDES